MNQIRFLWLGFLGLFNAENGRQKIFEKKNSSKKNIVHYVYKKLPPN